MILLLGLSVFGSIMLSRRAIKSVFKMFRKSEALTPETAKFSDEIGFKRQGIISFRGIRDYKPTALQLMMREEIVCVTEEGKLYLSEEKLAQHTLKNLDK